MPDPEKMGAQFTALYHGTHSETAPERIKAEGFNEVPGHIINPAHWPSVSDSRPLAERYGSHVVEFHVPHDKMEEHFHPGTDTGTMGEEATSYAVKKRLPGEWVQ